MSNASRRGLLAKIHIAKKQLGLSEEEYRGVLEARFGVDSAGDMRMQDMAALVTYFRSLGWQESSRRKSDAHGKPAPAAARRGLMRKIEALLAEKGAEEGSFVPWSYAASILKRQGGPERLEFATPDQLCGVIAALHRDAERQGRRTK